MTDFDVGLVLSIWTGSVPFIILAITYFLSKRTNRKKLMRSRKAEVYRKFLWAVGDAVQALEDLRTSQLSKISDPKDEDEVKSNAFKIASLPTIWTNPDAMDAMREIVMSNIEGDEREKPKPKEVVDAFENMKELFNMELAHVFYVNIKHVGRFAEEIGTFGVSEALKDSMKGVLDLVAQRQYVVFSGSLLELAGLKGLDTGRDVEKFIADWNTALGKLRTELDKDLKATF